MALAAPVLGAACGLVGDDESAERGQSAAQSADEPPAQAQAHDEPLPMEVSDPLAQEDIAGLTAASEAVVRGTVVEAEAGVRVGAEQVRYTAYTVEVDEALSGAPADQIKVILSSQVQGRDVVVEGRPLPARGDEAIWFLTPIGPQFGYEGYVLSGQSGLLLFDGDEVVGGGRPDGPVASEVERLGHPQVVVERVRSVAG
jgi:hypothetical protein